jgi:hypothetical protein
MATAKRVTFFRVGIEDKPGSVFVLTKSLKSKNIGLVALWGSGTRKGKAEVCCIPKNPARFRAYARRSGVSIRVGTGVLLTGADRTGALVKAFQAIAKAGINLQGGIAIAAGGKYGAFLEVRQADLRKAASAIGVK